MKNYYANRANEYEKIVTEGDIVRFEENDIHGLRNDFDDVFEYISVTSPPIDFNYAHRDKRQDTLKK